FVLAFHVLQSLQPIYGRQALRQRTHIAPLLECERACRLEVRRVGSRRRLVGHYRLVDLLTPLRIERQRPSHHLHVVQQIVPVGEFGRHGLPPLGPRPAPPSQLLSFCQLLTVGGSGQLGKAP